MSLRDEIRTWLFIRFTELTAEEQASILQTIQQQVFPNAAGEITRWGEDWGENTYAISPATDVAAQVLVEVVPAHDFCYLVILAKPDEENVIVYQGKKEIFSFTQNAWKISARIVRYFIISPDYEWYLCEDYESKRLVGVGKKVVQAMQHFEDLQIEYSQSEIRER